MFTYYQVEGHYNFSHYGEALHFARQINGDIVIKKSWNPLRIIMWIGNKI